ncbi:SpvB/TcaC N-terminal domain-containing protein [Paenibacillus mendelii]|uniref:SpvB/TcaC N-terminal domain-containing protein n=1 Tax=Paenibacillus mendelii TaxID=206163 RepID=A0ABV6JFC8_9BACL|nr:SpvB/TcaC N-terminal domain-containing protein [Paenibacillus mendelii]MCQ6557498.1 hypothetical protein [Paenibacillus mendelii]
MADDRHMNGNPEDRAAPSAPSITLPKGGGAIRGIAEKFSANTVTGNGTMTVPLAVSPTRSGFGPELALTHDSGAGSGLFGYGWSLSIPAIVRKTDGGLPQYRDQEESDIYVLSGAEDLVPVLNQDGSRHEYNNEAEGFVVHRYRPRIEGLFARIERWTDTATGSMHWRSITGDNMTTVYGKSDNSRIADPDDPLRTFSWLISESYDDKGNAILYEYASENDLNIDRSLMNESSRVITANRYLKRIHYGNKLSRLVQPDLTSMEWMFEAVFDYDENHYVEDGGTAAHGDTEQLVYASASPGNAWAARPDPISSHRAGFEVRTYRRCRRLLMFHRFDELGSEPCLVRATSFEYADFDYSRPFSAKEELAYQGSTRLASFLCAIVQAGCIRDDTEVGIVRDGIRYAAYRRKEMPPLEFEYSRAAINGVIRELEGDSLNNLPSGLFDSACQWVDLDGEGISGILTEQADCWYYKPNLGGGRFGPQQVVAAQPSHADLRGGQELLLDLNGSGQLDVVRLSGQTSGYSERSQEQNWEPFKAFAHLPNIPWHEKNLRFIDLNGDGLADILLSEHHAFTWYPSLGGEGFGPAIRMEPPLDDERGVRLVVSEDTQSIYLADMCGDGLTDIVRIRNGEICYWPNQGYGRFGHKVTMDHSPWFDYPDQFNQRRLLLCDIDGSGVTDVIYTNAEGVHLYFNQSGNRWSDPFLLTHLSAPDHLSTMTAVDLLGNGTSCLVWSSPLPGHARQPFCYIDLMGGIKPHLLVRSINNFGAETKVSYVSSTTFYLADKAAGRPWATKLPFPVQVVAYVEKYDHVGRSRFTTRYAYHHGYYDGKEREFRGFGMVEQWDSEAYEDYAAGVASSGGSGELAPEFFQPPVTTRTWFHTGASIGKDRIVHQLRNEYYESVQYVPEPMLPQLLEEGEWEECLRALKGLPLRQEIYSFDGSDVQAHPYRIVEHNYEIKRIQPRRGQAYAVFLPVGSETVTLDCERNPEDPHISHQLNLLIDQTGHVLQSGTVVYGRRIANPLLPVEVTRAQQSLHIVCRVIEYTAEMDREAPDAAYRRKVPFASRSYEVSGLEPADQLFTITELLDALEHAALTPYEEEVSPASLKKRLIAHNRVSFLDNGFNRLPFGERDTLGLEYESYRLAFTPEVIDIHYAGGVSALELEQAGYIQLSGEPGWWIPSGTAIYPSNPADHYYIAIGAKDPLGTETIASLDRYDLLVEEVRVKQAAWNVMRAHNDYRTLGPTIVIDPNDNRTAVEVDSLGMVVRTAFMGKPGDGDGDTLADPTIRLDYNLFQWRNERKPNFVHVYARERHGAVNPRWQESCVYSNGSGSIAMVKAQAHPGKALQLAAAGGTILVDANPRWVGSGRTIRNNKGSPVKQYEPYFSTTERFEDERELREIGVTPLIFYDAVGRTIRTVYPDGTETKVEFDCWQHRAFDKNDTVLGSSWYSDRGSPDPLNEPEPLQDPKRRAAWLAAKHADTPGITHLDSLGRIVCSVSDYGGGRTAAVRSDSDLSGRFSRLFDQIGREAASGFNGMSGIPMWSDSAERGRRWSFFNVLGALVKSWDQHGRRFRTEYDSLHRPVGIFAEEPGRGEFLFRYLLYGDRHPDARRLNLLGVTHQVYDQAGRIEIPESDFKGNPKRVERILAKDYKQAPDWRAACSQTDYQAVQDAASPSLAMDEVFASATEYDALNRPIQMRLPDGSVMVPEYNEGNFWNKLSVQVRGQGSWIDCLKGQDYDAKGRRLSARYGNDIETRYEYDPESLRLTGMLTYPLGSNPELHALQNMQYTFDPAGNLTHAADQAQQTYYFNNAVIKPEYRYEYDAIYQLISATGREHAGMANDAIRSESDLDYRQQLPDFNQPEAVRTYTEEYDYDLLGNMTAMRHRYKTQAGIGNGWTRHYRYIHEDSPGNRTNRLGSTSLPGDTVGGPYGSGYDYDAYGNMTRMPHLQALAWNCMDQLSVVDLGGGGTAYYVYDSGGRRIRKVIERPGGAVTERLYLGSVEIYRERLQDAVHLERLTLTVSDDTGPIAQVDTKTRDDRGRDPANPLHMPLIRYQHGNLIGSAVFETDVNGVILSYEEYHPFGTTAYRSAKSGSDISLKRYRFCGKERDDETGLYYYGARYYATWLGRWTSADPAGFADGANLFIYCRNSPVAHIDPQGLTTRDIPGTSEDHLTENSTLADREAFARRHGFRIVDPHPEQQRWNGYKWELSPEGRFERIQPGEESGAGDGSAASEAPVCQPPPEPSEESASEPPPEEQPPGESPPESPDESSSGSEEGSGDSGERRFFTSSFFKGLVIGIAVTAAVIAVVATGGAALAVIAPAASSAIAASGVGTALAVAGGVLTAANITQSIRQRDLMNNRISEEQANFNLGLGVGSLAGGALAKPITAAAAPIGRGLGQGVSEIGESMSTGLLVPALPIGPTGGAISVAASGSVSTTSAVTAAGVGMGPNVLMMSRGDDDDDGSSFERMTGGGRNRPRGNQIQNKQFNDIVKKYNLTKDEKQQLHRAIQGEDLDYHGLEDAVRSLFPHKF